MNSIQLLPWQFAYVAVAVLFAAASLAVADHLRSGEPPNVLTRGGVAAVAGVLWPVMLVGAAQLWLISRIVNTARPSRPEPATVAPRGLIPAA